MDRWQDTPDEHNNTASHWASDGGAERGPAYRGMYIYICVYR